MKQTKFLIEDGFPFAPLSIVAEQESWRKEVNRPAAYIHKWWARRLGSIFRGLIIGGFEHPNVDFFEKFYNSTSYQGKIVFDPFMGSGTTIHEAIKLGATAIGSDINPVASALVRAACEMYNRDDVMNTYSEIAQHCQEQIKKYYRAKFHDKIVDVLYYFWVKTVTCDDCGTDFPLMKSSIFSKNANPTKKPESKSLCPYCNHINTVLYNDISCECANCHKCYNPQKGNVRGNNFICPTCGKKERIVDYMRRKGKVPSDKMYAKMILDASGQKYYARIDDYDVELYREAQKELSNYAEYIPNDKIHKGFNTNQILNYQYTHWREMFNDRQLLSFGILSKAIKSIHDRKLRRLFGLLMSGTLEFNNMFCSFKGEGTGAVRPLFFNHILKNELMPLEANPWGCKASSGSFSTLFESRILRMLDYKNHPFELRPMPDKKSEKVYLIASKDQAIVVENENDRENGTAIIMCKDSSNTTIPDGYVDLILTDPPFFDNVNYSELADFFYVWLKRFDIGVGSLDKDTTRNIYDVQDNDSKKFSNKLSAVFKECNRVLKEEGLLVFTYHHSRAEGWVSVYDAIVGAGFNVSQILPLKAEMAVSVPIIAAKEPINYDLVFVCRKTQHDDQSKLPFDISINYQDAIRKIEECGLEFSQGDKMILRYGQALKKLSDSGKSSITEKDIEEIVQTLHA